MDINKFLNEGLDKQVPNPNYNPRSKKNKGPKTVTITDLGPDRDNTVSMVGKGMLEQYSISAQQAKRYRDEGLSWNPYDNLEKELADNQGVLEQAYNSFIQTTVGEIGIGTVKGFSDLIDATLAKVFKVVDDDYTNPVSKQLQEWQDAVKESHEIYMDPERTSIDTGGLLSPAWYLSNLPSVASTLTLMLPGLGVSKGVSYLGKLTKIGSGLSKAREFTTGIKAADRLAKAAKEGEQLNRLENSFVKASQWANSKSTITTANNIFDSAVSGMTMRVVENYQEANQVYDDMYKEASDILGKMEDSEYSAWLNDHQSDLEGFDGNTTNRAEVAKFIAKNSADTTFKLDFANSLFDVYQMYTLKNITRFMNAPSRASVRREHLNSIKYAGKTQKEVEEILAKRKLYQKAFDKFDDYARGSWRAFIAEANEGVEEAVNYIAQQEGMHYGDAILDTLDKDAPFDQRLSEYLVAPELHDAAFWGLMGGIVFQAGASKVQQAYNATTKKIQERELNKKLSDSEKVNTPWLEYFKDSEIENRKADIRYRYQARQELNDKLKKIEAGVNPYIDSEKSDAEKAIDGGSNSVEAEVLRDRAFAEFQTALLTRSMWSGNFNLTRDFLASDEVRESLVESGIVSREEAGKRQAQALGIASRIEKLYNQNMRAISNAVRGWDDETKAKYGDISMDYLQIIAAENMQHQINADVFTRNIERFNPAIAEAEEGVAEKLRAAGINYKDAVRKFVLAQQLGQVEAELREERKDKVANTVAGQQSILALETKKRALESLLFENEEDRSNTLGLAKALVAMQAQFATVIGADGKFSMDLNSKEYKDLDALLIEAVGHNLAGDKILDSVPEEQAKKAFEKLRKYSSLSGLTSLAQLEEAIGQSRVYSENIRLALSDTSFITTLDNISNSLLKMYAAVTYNEISRATELAQIRTTRDEITEGVDLKHNSMITNISRYLSVEQQTAKIKRIAKKYIDEYKRRYTIPNVSLGELLVDSFVGQNETNNAKLGRQVVNELLSTADKALLRDIGRALNLQNIHNKKLIETLRRVMRVSDSNNYNDVDITEEEEEGTASPAPAPTTTTTTPTTSGQSSSTSGNRGGTAQTSGTSRTSATGTQSGGEATRGQKLDFGHLTNGAIATNHRAEVVVDADAKPVALKQASPNENDNLNIGVKELDANNTDIELDYMSDIENELLDTDHPTITSELFDIKTPVLSGGVIVKNPVVHIDKNGNITSIDKGTIDIKSSEEEGEEGGTEEGSTEEGGTPAADSSTGEETEDSDESAEDEGAEMNYEPSEVIETGSVFGYSLYLEDEDISNEDVAAAVREEIASLYPDTTIDEQYVQQAVDDAIALIDSERNTTKRGTKKQRKQRNKEKKDITDAYRASEILDSAFADKSGVSTILNDALDSVINNFLNNVNTKPVNGVIDINTESIVRYINSITDDSRIAEYLYERIVDHIKSKNATRRGRRSRNNVYYRITNSNETKEEVINNASKAIGDRINEILNNSSIAGQTVGIDNLSYYEGYEKADWDKFYELLDNISPGKKIDYEVVDKGKALRFTIDGVAVGRVPIPKVKGDGSYEMVNQGWRTVVPSTNDGTRSKIQQLFINIFNDKDIRGLLDEAKTIRKKIKVDGKEIDNPKYDEIRDKVIEKIEEKFGSISEHVDTDNNNLLVTHLLHLYNYVKTISDQTIRNYDMDIEEYNELINESRIKSIDSWFAKLRVSYASVELLYSRAQSGNPVNLSVDTLSRGGIIDTGNELHPIADEKTIGSKHRDSLQLVVSSINEVGKLYSTDGSVIDSPGTYKGRTQIAIVGTDGKVMYANAFPQKLSSDNFKDNEKAKALHKAIENDIRKRLQHWFDNPNTSVDELYNFLFALTNKNKGANANLFMNGDKFGIAVSRNDRGYSGFKIDYRDDKGNKHRIVFYDKYKENNISSISVDGESGVSKTREHSHDDLIDDVVKSIVDNLRYNVEPEFIKSDSNTNAPVPSPFVHRNEKGEFVLTFDGKEFVYDSYKDFILSNNAISVNTQSEDGKTNYYRRGDSNRQIDNTQLTFKVDSTTPVEETTTEEETTIPETSVTEETLGDEITKGINDGTITGSDIISKLLNKTQLVYLEKSELLNKLSFKNVRVLNLPNVIARHYHEDSEITVDGVKIKIAAGTIVLGNDFINLINGNEIDKLQATRHIIHEAIHNYIAFNINSEQKTNLFNNIRKIFNTFVAANEKEGIEGGIRLFEYRTNPRDNSEQGNERYLRRYYSHTDEEGNTIITDEINERGLEEFLVESLTRPELMRRLNELDENGDAISDNGIRRKSYKAKSLFQRILSALASIFNIDINKGSLLDKEYRLFKETMDGAIRQQELNFEESVNEQSTTEVPTEAEQMSLTASPTTSENVESETNDTTSIDMVETNSDNIDFDDDYSDILDEHIASLDSIRRSLTPSSMTAFDKLVSNNVINISCKL